MHSKIIAFTIAATTIAAETPPSPSNAPIVRAAAFDLGSGKTKMTIADVERNPTISWSIVDTLYSTEEIVKFSDDLAVSQDGKLSNEIQEKGITILKKLKEIALHQFGVHDYCCIATEVFRKAINGKDFINRIEEEVGIPVHLISQEQEALLGFTTGIAVGSLAPERALIVDHGSGSFQISSQDNESLVSFNGQLGTIPLAQILIQKVQKSPYKRETAPNPLSESEALSFVEYVHSGLSQIPEWLTKKVANPQLKVIGLGGPTGTFGMCATIAGTSEFTKDELWMGIEKLLYHSASEIQKAHPSIYDPTLLPRTLFIYGLMTLLKLQKITWCQSIGCTEGMLITPLFWQATVIN